MSHPIDPLYFQLFEVKPRKGDLKKAEIVQAAMSLLAEKGLAGVTHESIASRLGLRRSHVAYYFKNTEDILIVAIQIGLARGQGLVIKGVRDQGATPDSQELLKAYIDGNFEMMQDREIAALLTVLYGYSLISAPFRKIQESIKLSGHNRLISILGNWNSKKRSKLKAPIETIAKDLHALVTGNILYHTTSSESYLKGQYEAASKETLASCLRVIDRS